MRLVAIGGDMRMNGAVLAARRAGWDADWIRGEDEAAGQERADVVILPWPRSFADGKLTCAPPGEAMEKARALELVPPCAVALHGAGIAAGELSQAQARFDPSQDEAFLRKNARLTAEGAIAAAMRSAKRALLGSTCLVTGFGRIGQELTLRLCAMGAFVIVCARSEEQMRAAHAIGAHPVPLAQLASAAGQADLLFNTVPARVLGQDALAAIGKDAILFELASAPYGEDVEEAVRMGVNLHIESGIPGRYAPMEAGEALFEAAQRYLSGAERAERAAKAAREAQAARALRDAASKAQSPDGETASGGAASSGEKTLPGGHTEAAGETEQGGKDDG